MLDLFSGIGGFHKGFEQAGYEFDWVGFSEIDKYASAVYRHRFPKAEELGDITTIQPGDLPKIDLITFGSPCQDFSIAGKRAGAKEGTRSSLVWQAIRLITECKPRFFVWENVKGTFSSNSGADFWAIIQAFTNIGGYRLEWQLINTRWFLPQNRERIYLVGYIGDRSGQSVFPIGETDEVYNRKPTQNHSTISNCIDSNYHKGWLDHGQRTMIAELNQIGTIGKDSEATRCAKTGLYQVYDSYNKNIRKDGIVGTLTQESAGRKDMSQGFKVIIPEATKKGYAEAEEGDSINLSVPNSKTRRGRVGKGEAQTLDTGMQQYTIQPVLTPNRAEKKQNGRRFKEDGEDMFTLTGQDQHGVMVKQKEYAPCIRAEHHNTADVHYIPERSQIRRLTPVECCRLQGFPDDWNEFGEFDGEVVPMSDTQRYKQAGNAVTVNVVQAVAERIASPKVQSNEKG